MQCVPMYRVWARVAKIWDLTFMGAGDNVTNFDIWFHAFSRGLKERI